MSSRGINSVLLRDACVGDEEDLPYSKFAISQLLSKQSASFAMDGFTGSTNGHFGSPIESKPRPWVRVAA